MFCHITQNWRGKPLRSRAVIVNLIGGTTTKEGLRIEAELDTDLYRMASGFPMNNSPKYNCKSYIPR